MIWDDKHLCTVILNDNWKQYFECFWMGIDHNHDTQNKACTCGTQKYDAGIQLIKEKQVNHCDGLIQAIDKRQQWILLELIHYM